MVDRQGHEVRLLGLEPAGAFRDVPRVYTTKQLCMAIWMQVRGGRAALGALADRRQLVLTRHERGLYGARATLGGAGVTHRTGMGPRRRFGARLTPRGAWVTHLTGMEPRLRLAARSRGGVNGSVCSRRLARGGL